MSFTCPNLIDGKACGSRDIRQTATGFFENNYICKKCKHSFTHMGTGIIGAIAGGLALLLLELWR